MKSEDLYEIQDAKIREIFLNNDLNPDDWENLIEDLVRKAVCDNLPVGAKLSDIVMMDKPSCNCESKEEWGL